MDEVDPNDAVSRGWKPPLFINFLIPSTIIAFVVSKYPEVKTAIYYTAVGVIDIFVTKP